MAVAAPVIAAEMADWTILGGVNSGIVGDAAHTYGFHLSANQVGPGDYSRARDPKGPNGPYPGWDWACAGDFSHRNNETLRAMHRRVLARLMAGELPMICEFIGKPWADRPVYYWARWNGVQTLQRYTGAGHDHWSHISWYRSMADQRAYLWTEDTMDPTERGWLEDIAWTLEALRSGLSPLPESKIRPPHLNKPIWIIDQVRDLKAKVDAKATPTVDEAALKAALLQVLADPQVKAALGSAAADATADKLAQRLKD